MDRPWDLGGVCDWVVGVEDILLGVVTLGVGFITVSVFKFGRLRSMDGRGGGGGIIEVGGDSTRSF